MYVSALLFIIIYSPKVDVEVDAQIEGNLAAECSLVVLDTLEMLVQTQSENVNSMLGRVRTHIYAYTLHVHAHVHVCRGVSPPPPTHTHTHTH